MRFLITGTAGFIGFHLAKRLLADGHDVQGVDGMTPYYDVALKKKRQALLTKSNRFTAHTLMLEDEARLASVYAEAKPDVVVHLAAQAGVRYSLENPRAYVDTNLVGTFNLLELLRKNPPKHFLLASTSSVYGANDKMPFLEVDRADFPMTLYAATKKAGELMAHSYAHLFDIPTTALRFFTVYGPWGRPDMALFKFVSAMLRDEEIELYGHGKVRRDFTYIDDLIEALLRLADLPPSEANRVENGAVDTLSRQAPFRALNIGAGRPIDVLTLVDAVEQALGRKARTRLLPMQRGDVPQTFASADLLKALTGFVPQVEVIDGVRAFVEWYRSQTPAGQ
jgi:UDP-glucuronate 4-epimerase